MGDNSSWVLNFGLNRLWFIGLEYRQFEKRGSDMKRPNSRGLSSLLVAVAAMFALVLVGCGGKQVAPTSQKTATTSKTDHPTTDAKTEKAKPEHPSDHPKEHPSDHPK